MNMTKATIKIEGMMCQHCVNRVTSVLNAISGVTSVAVSLENGTAAVATDGTVEIKALKEAVEDAGFDVTGIEEE